jgi:hypothetical protein
MRELNELRQEVGTESPELTSEINELIREVRKLDPSRFPGNPELVARAAQLLPAIEQLELRLRRKLEEQEGGSVRSGAPQPIPTGYATAVAEYFRRLSRGK